MLTCPGSRPMLHALGQTHARYATCNRSTDKLTWHTSSHLILMLTKVGPGTPQPGLGDSITTTVRKPQGLVTALNSSPMLLEQTARKNCG